MKSAPTNAALAAAIESLERSRVRERLALLAIGLAVGAVASAAVAHGGPAAASLDVKQIILRDDGGNARAKLAMGEGGPRLAFADAQGHARLVLGTDAGGSPIFAMSDEKAVVRVWMTIEPFGASMNLKDAKGVVRASLVVAGGPAGSAAEGPRFELFDAQRTPRASLVANDVESGLRVGPGAGAAFGALRSTAEGPRIDVVGADGKPLFHAP